jgi:hypothetical protein
VKFNEIEDTIAKERLVYKIDDFNLNIRDRILYPILALLESALNIVD